jgi:hypothetical protein
MINSVSQSRKLLVGCLAAAGLAVAASPASAWEIYELQYHTASQDGDIYFYAPPPSALPPTLGQVPGLITGIVPDGTIVNGSPIFNTETTTGLTFNNNGNPVPVTGLLAPNSFGNVFGGANDNLLLSFVPNVSSNPPTSNLANSWFTDQTGVNPPGGIAFQAADGTQVSVFTFGGQLWAESIDIFGNDIYASQVAGGLSTLTALGAPGPTPATGYLGLFGLAIGAAALKLRERLAR